MPVWLLILHGPSHQAVAMAHMRPYLDVPRYPAIRFRHAPHCKEIALTSVEGRRSPEQACQKLINIWQLFRQESQSAAMKQYRSNLHTKALSAGC
eukprot:scaffold114679_cov18-Tisochrysis_lutea.AAC.1